MANIRLFEFEQSEVRTIMIDKNPYFVGKDVAEILGYSNTRDAIRKHVEKEDKLPSQNATQGLTRNMILINESGLYSLIFGSKLESAKRFKRWVTSEVLPIIRQTGTYNVPSNPMDALKLMFEVQQQTSEKVDSINDRVTDIEQNKLLTPGEYCFLGRVVKNKVYKLAKELEFDWTKEQRAVMFKAINGDLNRYLKIETRSQVRFKDYDRALKFLDKWVPSYTVLEIVKEMY